MRCYSLMNDSEVDIDDHDDDDDDKKNNPKQIKEEDINKTLTAHLRSLSLNILRPITLPWPDLLAPPLKMSRPIKLVSNCPTSPTCHNTSHSIRPE